MYLSNIWRPALAILGANGLPPCEVAGNVMRPFTELKFSMRVPPNADVEQFHDRMV